MGILLWCETISKIWISSESKFERYDKMSEGNHCDTVDELARFVKETNFHFPNCLAKFN